MRNLLVDVVVAGVFLLAFNPESTGAGLHEWIGIAAVGAIVTHLLWHWRWLFSVTKRLATRKGSGRSKLRFGLDAGLLATVVVLTWSGLATSKAVSSFIGLGGGGGDGWKSVHETTANVALWFIVLHAALHWRWIRGVVRTIWNRRSATPSTAVE